jgi:hypothetical protein
MSLWRTDIVDPNAINIANVLGTLLILNICFLSETADTINRKNIIDALIPPTINTGNAISMANRPMFF